MQCSTGSMRCRCKTLGQQLTQLCTLTVLQAVQYWIKSGRAETEGRLEQWQEYISLQEKAALQDAFRKTVAQVWSLGGSAAWFDWCVVWCSKSVGSGWMGRLHCTLRCFSLG